MRDIKKIRELVERLRPLPEMIIVGSGHEIVAFKDKIYAFEYTDWEEKETAIVKDLARYFPQYFNETLSFSDFGEFCEYIKDKKLSAEVLTGFIDHNRILNLHYTGYHAPSGGNVLLNKVAKQMQAFKITVKVDAMTGEQPVAGQRKEVPEVVYHGTSSNFMNDILKYGIKPVEHSNWTVNHEGLIFFSSKPQVAKFHADMTWNKTNAVNPIVLEVTIPDPSKLLIDYDLYLEITQGKSDFSLKQFYDAYVKNPNSAYSSGNDMDSRKILGSMRDSGIYAYKGRIPANFIKSIWVRESYSWKQYTPQDYMNTYKTNEGFSPRERVQAIANSLTFDPNHPEYDILINVNINELDKLAGGMYRQ